MAIGRREIVFLRMRIAVHRYAAAWLLILESLAETHRDVTKLLELMLKPINQNP